MNKDFLGTGFSFRLGPHGSGGLTVDGQGRISLSRHERDIEEAILIILNTAKGERVMRPEFGSRLPELVFMPINSTTMALATLYVEEALAMWEPRIAVMNIVPVPDPSEESTLLIGIQYRIKATNDERSLVYPFYTIPGEE